MGRPTLLTDELRERIESGLADGVPQVVLAQRLGISARSISGWLHDGKITRLVRELPRLGDSDWQVAARALEASFPERWGTPQ
jgi:hypothetical protein